MNDERKCGIFAEVSRVLYLRALRGLVNGICKVNKVRLDYVIIPFFISKWIITKINKIY